MVNSLVANEEVTENAKTSVQHLEQVKIWAAEGGRHMKNASSRSEGSKIVAET